MGISTLTSCGNFPSVRSLVWTPAANGRAARGRRRPHSAARAPPDQTSPWPSTGQVPQFHAPVLAARADTHTRGAGGTGEVLWLTNASPRRSTRGLHHGRPARPPPERDPCPGAGGTGEVHRRLSCVPGRLADIHTRSPYGGPRRWTPIPN